MATLDVTMLTSHGRYQRSWCFESFTLVLVVCMVLVARIVLVVVCSYSGVHSCCSAILYVYAS